MSTETSLEQLIEGQAGPETTQAAEAPQAAQVPEQTGEVDAAPPAAGQTKADDGPMVPRRALEDERRKRQEFEQRVNEMQRWVEQQQQLAQRPQQELPPQPDIWSDPQGALKHLQTQMQEQFERELFVAKVEQGQEVMRLRHADYDEVEQIFVAAAQNAPQLAQAMRRSNNPARFAYETGKRLRMMQEIGDDPEAYVERKLAERLQANGGQAPTITAPQSRPTTPARTSAPVPRSLASTNSAPPRNERGQFAERAPLDELFGS